jgi:hypothetical protein
MQGEEKEKFNTPKEKYYRKQHEQWMENIISDSNGLSVLTEVILLPCNVVQCNSSDEYTH